MAPLAALQCDLQQPRGMGWAAGDAGQLSGFSAQSRQVAAGLLNRLPRRAGDLAELPTAPAAGDGQQPFAIPGVGTHAKHPLGHRELRFQRQQWGPVGRLQGGLGGAGPALQIPKAAAVIGDHEVLPRPDGLKDRDRLGVLGGGAGHPLGPLERTGTLDLRQPEAAAVPGHGRLLPLHPGQPRSIGAQGGVAAEVGRLMQQLEFPAGQGQGRQLIDSIALEDTDPAVLVRVDQAAPQGSLEAIPLGWSSRCGSAPA